MSTRTVSIDDARFEPVVIRSELPVLVEFWAPGCGPCRLVAPILEDLAEEYAGRLRIARLNTEGNPERVWRHAVRGVPTMILFRNGAEADRVVGALPKPLLRLWIERALEG